MEEILASIRRIISEDEEEPAARPASRAAPPPEQLAAAPKPSAVIKPPPAPASVEPEQKFATEDVEMIRKNVAEAMTDEDDGIVEEATAAAASSAFMSLSQSVQVSDGQGRTLEDLVVEMLRPMVKDWLDANLAQIVEEKVEEEVQRVARRRR
jgi:cell pole-organizing protein PopZ